MAIQPSNCETDFQMIRQGPLHGVVHRVWQERLGDLEELLEEILAQPGKVLRKGGGQGVTSVKEFDGETLYFKVYFPDLWRRRLRDLLIKPRWRREWEANCRAQSVGVQSARIVAAFGKREGFNTTHLVVTEAIEGKDIASLLSRTEDEEKRHAILAKVGHYVGRLHAIGFWHAHLHCKHIFMSDEGEIALIDLERSCVSPSLSRERVRRNLHQVRKSVGKYARKGELPIFDQAYRQELNGDQAVAPPNGVRA